MCVWRGYTEEEKEDEDENGVREGERRKSS